jgi:uncharacterized membrane protein SpoIIM required for sporulation
MLTPLQFEARYAPGWVQLETQLELLEAGNTAADAALVASGYRAACEHLALARERGYPLHVAERLDALTARAHRLIYRQPGTGRAALARFMRHTFPATLRAHGPFLAVAALVFTLPLVAVGLATWRDPSFALTLMDAGTLSQFDSMYGDFADSIGRTRDADTDWVMFGYYLRNNISVAFQCFATGLLLGLGSLFFLGYNGALIGAVAGYLTAKGLGHNFWPFVATHSSFELTAIVISGAAGLMLGHALLAPGRLSRGHALRQAARRAAVLVGGATALLVVAAAVEAFWSSAKWLPLPLKLGVAALCWVALLAYLWRSGRAA